PPPRSSDSESSRSAADASARSPADHDPMRVVGEVRPLAAQRVRAGVVLAVDVVDTLDVPPAVVPVRPLDLIRDDIAAVVLAVDVRREPFVPPGVRALRRLGLFGAARLRVDSLRDAVPRGARSARGG